MEIKVTKYNFEDEVINADLPVLVDFWATWCGPCRMVAPELEKLANENAETLRVGKINVDEEGELAMQFNVEVIPTLVLIKDGKEVKRASGFMTADQIKAYFGL